MVSRKQDIISEALRGANGAIAMLTHLQRSAPKRALREEMGRHLREIQRQARKLKIMQQPGARRSLVRAASVLGQMVDTLISVLTLFPPES